MQRILGVSFRFIFDQRGQARQFRFQFRRRRSLRRGEARAHVAQRREQVLKGVGVGEAAVGGQRFQVINDADDFGGGGFGRLRRNARLVGGRRQKLEILAPILLNGRQDLDLEAHLPVVSLRGFADCGEPPFMLDAGDFQQRERFLQCAQAAFGDDVHRHKKRPFRLGRKDQKRLQNVGGNAASAVAAVRCAWRAAQFRPYLFGWNRCEQKPAPVKTRANENADGHTDRPRAADAWGIVGRKLYGKLLMRAQNFARNHQALNFRRALADGAEL
jgi:hypothetical protein